MKPRSSANKSIFSIKINEKGKKNAKNKNKWESPLPELFGGCIHKNKTKESRVFKKAIPWVQSWN